MYWYKTDDFNSSTVRVVWASNSACSSSMIISLSEESHFSTNPSLQKRFVRTNASLLSFPTETACCRLLIDAMLPTERHMNVSCLAASKATFRILHAMQTAQGSLQGNGQSKKDTKNSFCYEKFCSVAIGAMLQIPHLKKICTRTKSMLTLKVQVAKKIEGLPCDSKKFWDKLNYECRKGWDRN